LGENVHNAVIVT